MFLALTGLSATCAAMSPPKVIWMTATLDGRKVGHLHYQRRVEGDKVITRSTLDIRLARTGKPLNISNTVKEVETTGGEPMDFTASTLMSSVRSMATGTRTGPGLFKVRTQMGRQVRTYSLSWTKGALFDNGVRRAIVEHGFAPGTHYQLQRFDSSSQSVTPLQMAVVGPETVELPQGTVKLTHIRQTRQGPRAAHVTDLWVDAQGDVLKIGMPLLGFRMELLACSETCALRPNQNVSLLKNAMVMVPRPLPKLLREAPIRFVFRISGDEGSPFINTDMQRSRQDGKNTWVVETVPLRNGVESPPTSDDLAPNDWLQSDSPKIQSLANQAVDGAKGDLKRMQRMTRFVRDYIKHDGASVGYASALETAHSRQGDCTEYAVLLAAMARAQHIPARVVTGLAYAGHYAGKDGVLVPHTWVQAWIDGSWREFDSAMPHYDRTHLAMAYGNGDPWKYFNGINNLGRLDLLQVLPGDSIGQDRPLTAPSPPPPPPNPAGGPG